jgi:hypothetical protein
MLRHVAAAVVASAALVSSASAEIVIDHFDLRTASYPLVRDSLVGSQYSFPGVDDAAANVPGGIRGVGLYGENFEVLGFDEASARVFTGGVGFCDYQSSTGADADLGLFYGSALFIPPGDLNLDFTGGVSFDIKFLAYDAPGNLPMTVELLLLRTSEATITTMLSGVVPMHGAQTLSIGLGGVNPNDLADVDGIALIFRAPQAADFRIDKVSVSIPEPAALGLLAPVGLALGRRRR